MVAALKAAQAGDVIQLAPGNYAPITISGLDFGGAGVTITSLDAGNQATLNGFTIRNSDGLTFRGLELNVDPAKASPYQVLDSGRINLDQLNVHGTLNGNPQGDSGGLMIRRSDGVTVTNSEFHELATGVTHTDSRDITIEGNQFHEIQMDGVRGGGTSQITISNNTFTDFRPEVGGGHPDAIQFWTTNTTSSATDITVSGNVILRGSGAPVQGIFFRDQVETLPYKNVVISDNLVLGAAYNGIQVNGAQNLTLENNTVAGLADQKSWIGLQSVSGVTLTGNKATQFLIEDTVTALVRNGDVVTPTPADGGGTLQEEYLASHPLTLAADLLSATATSFSRPALSTFPAARTSLSGTEGADRLKVDANLDTRIEAGAGDDLLVGGGAGHNTLVGGAGNDTYRVGSARDTVVEGANGGEDTVLASVDFVLSGNVERLTLTGDARKGVGNGLDNRLTGSAGDDTLSGLGGDDDIKAHHGSDSILGGDGDDAIFGGNGADTAVGGRGADKLRGDAGSDSLAGGDGADTLDGSAGADTLAGGAGSDKFSYGDAELPAGETIFDFRHAEGDVISFAQMDANTNLAGDQRFAFIGTSAFSKSAGELRYEVYGKDAILMGDVNGDGLADFKLLVQGVSSFQSGDFLL